MYLRLKQFSKCIGSIIFLMIILTGCEGADGQSNDDPASPQSNDIVNLSFDPNNPGSGFTPVNDPSEQDELIQEIWDTISTQHCWDASFVGDSTAAGTPAGTSQFEFYGQYQYRYVGTMDTYLGDIYLYGIGYYHGYKTVIFTTWTDDVEGLVVIDASKFLHILKNPDGTPFSTTYTLNTGNCM